jgi:hypothetical protein
MNIITKTEYLNTLPDNITEISIHHYIDKDAQFPDLLRFYKLRILRFQYNNFTTLPSLPPTVKRLEIMYNPGLVSIPELPPNLQILSILCNKRLTHIGAFPTTLTELNCNENDALAQLPALPQTLTRMFCCRNCLTEIPALPTSLTVLHCDENRLHVLPKLPSTLQELFCSQNRIEMLPLLPDSLTELYCSNNPLIGLGYYPFYEFMDDDDDGFCSAYRKWQTCMERFRFQWYCLKFKRQFRDWLFVRVREKRAMEQYHPDRIRALLDSGVDIEDVELEDLELYL